MGLCSREQPVSFYLVFYPVYGRMKRYLILLFSIPVILACFSSFACKESTGEGQNGEELIVAGTTSMIGDLASQIAGDRARVEHIMGAGIDPHQYKATPGDANLLNRADVIFYNGLNLEARMTDMLESMKRRKTVIRLSDHIEEEKIIQTYEGANIPDPHIWFDVGLWSKTVPVVVETLSEKDPDNADYYRESGRQYRETLSELDTWVEKRIREIPQKRRVLITAHDAFGYFGRRYEIEVEALQGVSTVSEMSTSDVERLGDLMMERGITALFLETSIPPRNIEAVINYCRNQGFQVERGGELYSDALGEPQTPAGTYTGMVRHNVNTIVEELK